MAGSFARSSALNNFATTVSTLGHNRVTFFSIPPGTWYAIAISDSDFALIDYAFAGNNDWCLFAPRRSFSLLQWTRTCTRTTSPGQAGWSACCPAADPWFHAAAVPRRMYSWTRTSRSDSAGINCEYCPLQVTLKVLDLLNFSSISGRISENSWRSFGMIYLSRISSTMEMI